MIKNLLRIKKYNCHFCKSKTDKFLGNKKNKNGRIPVCEKCMKVFLESYMLFEEIRTKEFEKSFKKEAWTIYG